MDGYITDARGCVVGVEDLGLLEYLPKGIWGDNGQVQTPNYRLVGGEVVERTDEEKALDPYSDDPGPDYQAMQPDVLLAVRTLLPQVVAEEDMALHMGLYPDWQAGLAYRKDEVLRHGGILYQVQQDVMSQAHQPPGSEGLLAIYRPFQGQVDPSEVLPWVEGEVVQFGDRRMYEGTVYLCIGPGGAGANVWPPPTAPAIWEKVVET